jgi:acyl-CoA dehydrogenase
MDFRLTDDLQELQGLAREMFADLATTDRVRAVETTDTRLDDVLWAELGKAGLLGLAVPEEHDGAGLGLDAVCVVLEEQGRRVAPVPLWSHAVGAHVLARHASPELAAALLPRLAAGTARVTLALEEYDGASPAAPSCAAVATGDAWQLTGVKAVVPTPLGADHVLVSATAPDGPGLFLLANDGLTWESTETTSLDLAGHLVLDGTPAERIGDASALGDVLRWSALALAALQVGVADGAMRLAADYVSARKQFGRPLGSFQAVQHQLADCWMDVDAMRLTLWQALADDTERSALVATWWCDQAGLDVVHRVQHVHGGIGVDVDYPVHRHFLWGKQISSTLGGSAAALADLGDLVALEEVVS